MKRLIALVVVLGMASCAHQRPQTRETMQNAMIATAVITGVMLLTLAVPCDGCNLDDATRLARQ